MYKVNGSREERTKLVAKVAQELQISEGKVFAQVPHPVIITSANNRIL